MITMFSGHPVQFGSLKMDERDLETLRQRFANRQAALLDIDTQHNFMITPEPGQERQALYVPNAESIIGRLKQLTQLIGQFKLPALFTKDTHTPDDPEFQDYLAISDSHCVKGTPGWEKIPETVLPNENAAIIPEDGQTDVPNAQRIQATLAQGQRFDIRKNKTSVFEGNPKANAFFANLKEAGVNTIVIYGVCTDICVQQAIDGLKARDFDVVVVSDAVHHLIKNGLDDPKDPTYGNIFEISSDQLEQVVRDAYK